MLVEGGSDVTCLRATRFPDEMTLTLLLHPTTCILPLPQAKRLEGRNTLETKDEFTIQCLHVMKGPEKGLIDVQRCPV